MRQSECLEAATKYFCDGKFNEARKLYEAIIKFNPTNTKALYNLGVTYLRLNDEEKAFETINKYIVLRPNDFRAHLQIGILLFQKNNYSLSIKFFKSALKLNSKLALAHLGLGIVYNDRNNITLAIKYLEKALSLNPQLNSAYEHLYLLSSKICDWDSQFKYEKILDRVSDKGIKNGITHVETPFVNISHIANPSINLTHAKFWSRAISSKITKLPAHRNKHIKGKRIKIGYLSNDFREHPIGQLVADIFSLHDKRNFEVFTYSYGPDDKSEIRKKIEKSSEHFKDLAAYKHKEIAEAIRKDNINILVDLVGYTGFAVPDVTAYKPAPIQINYLGYPGTMGASYYGYLIADKITIPPIDVKYYSEKVLYLPGCYQFYSSQKVANKTFSKTEFGLPENAFIFASFNSTWKVRKEDFDTWIRILKRVPNSVLWLYCPEQLARKNLQKYFSESGLTSSRLIFSGNLQRSKHLARIKLADLCLDTFIYNGHTTTSDILWAGVPVITLQGKHFASRVASSILNAVDLPQLVTQTNKEYEDLAVDFANNPEKLNDIRKSLNKNRKSCRLFNSQVKIRNLEKIYIKIQSEN